eukprot:1407252-Lingulodinium_polyedra.AAC.1
MGVAGARSDHYRSGEQGDKPPRSSLRALSVCSVIAWERSCMVASVVLTVRVLNFVQVAPCAGVGRRLYG